MGVLSGILPLIKKYWWVPIAVIIVLMLNRGLRRKVQTWFNKVTVKNYSERVEVSKGVSINLHVIAYNIYEDFHKGVFGMFENEADAIEELKKVPVELVPELAKEYAKIGKKSHNMYTDFVDFLTEKQYEEVINILE